MGVTTRGFHGRETKSPHKLPPGQYETQGFPVLSAGPIPRMQLDHWQFTIATEQGKSHSWSWPQLLSLPQEEVRVDIHCGSCARNNPH
jgi:DMSO/TMAO reductase YedYZ molybdopterin-dependent catalytic subunit